MPTKSPAASNLSVSWPDGEPIRLRTQLLSWHAQHGRHDLPWISSDDYTVAVSEIM